MSGLIVKSINSFWKGLHIKKEKLTIDGDSMLMIYIYMTVKAGFAVQDLLAQIKFMSEFTTPYVRNTRMGYCVTTLEIAINHILGLSKDEIFWEKEQSFENVWNEERRTLTQSFRDSSSLSSRASSLVIKDGFI